jgi:4a-hydroxytetrahydrobiopterin dehydratase
MTPAEIDAALATLPGWEREGDKLVRTVTAPSFADAITLVNLVAAAADELDHHPDIDVRYRDVTFRCWTHTTGGVTARDLDLARRIETLVER